MGVASDITAGVFTWELLAKDMKSAGEGAHSSAFSDIWVFMLQLFATSCVPGSLAATTVRLRNEDYCMPNERPYCALL